MRKSKLIPSLILLALCVGVLAFGIYAARPANNQITGTLSIIAPDKLIQLTGKVGDTTVIDTSSTAHGKTFNVKDNALQFNLQNVSSVEEVDDIVLEIHIENLSDKELGAYFYSGNTAKTTEAELSDILTTSTLSECISVSFSEYGHMMPSNSGTTDVIVMKIIFSLTKLTEDPAQLSRSFNYFLNIEEYSPNYTGTQTNVTNMEFVKVSSTVNGSQRTSLPANAFAGTQGSPNTTLKMVAIPGCVTSIGNNAFAYCTQLSGMFMGAGNVQLGTNTFIGVEVKDVDITLQTTNYALSNQVLTLKDNANVTDAFASIGAFVKEVHIPADAVYDSLAGVKHAKILKVNTSADYPQAGFTYSNGVLRYNEGAYSIGRRHHAGLEDVVREMYLPDIYGNLEPDYPGQGATGTFKNFTALEKVVFKSMSGASLLSGTFAGCTSLKYVYIPSSVTLDACCYETDGQTVYSPFAGCHPDLKIFFQSSTLTDARVLVKEARVYTYSDSNNEWQSAAKYAYQTGVTKAQYTQLTGQTL